MSSDSKTGIRRRKTDGRRKSFKCLQCSYKGRHYTHLRKHEILHGNGAFFKSSSDDYTAGTAEDLKVHTSVVEDDSKLFHCPLCPHWSKRTANLKIHMITHMEEKELEKYSKKCSYAGCSFKTIHDSGLREHRKTHSQEKPFSCSKCEYTSKWSGNLKTHMFIHLQKEEKEKLLKACTLKTCNFKTIYPGDFRSHILAHLGQKRPQLSSRRKRHEKINKRVTQAPFIATSGKATSDDSTILTLPIKEETDIKLERAPSVENQYGQNSSPDTKNVSLPSLQSKGMIKANIGERSQFLEMKLSSKDFVETKSGRRVRLRTRGSPVLRRLKLPDITCPGLRSSFKFQTQCKWCSYSSEDPKQLALHNENVHSLPYIALKMLL